MWREVVYLCWAIGGKWREEDLARDGRLDEEGTGIRELGCFLLRSSSCLSEEGLALLCSSSLLLLSSPLLLLSWAAELPECLSLEANIYMYLQKVSTLGTRHRNVYLGGQAPIDNAFVAIE